MKLFEYTDEHGNKGYKTSNGTVISPETIAEWKNLCKNLDDRTNDLIAINQNLKNELRANGYKC